MVPTYMMAAVVLWLVIATTTLVFLRPSRHQKNKCRRQAEIRVRRRREEAAAHSRDKERKRAAAT